MTEMAVASAKKKTKREFPQLFLGVDGGGTKTHVAMMDELGRVTCEGSAGPSNPLRVGVERAVSNILKAVNEACDRGGSSRADIAAATLGLAGVRRGDVRQRVRESFVERLGVKHAEVITDAEIALFATTLGQPGVVVIAGTGSVCLGKNADGRMAIAGGWGPLAGDEGGGAGIAQEALHSVAKASDGRGAPTLLTEYASEYFRAAGPENLIVAIYSPQVDNTRIAGFAKYVISAAERGDIIANAILTDAGRELGMAACSVLQRLDLADEKTPIGCVGGVFNAGELLTGPMLKHIRECSPSAYLTSPKMPPSHAAARMALASLNGGLPN